MLKFRTLAYANDPSDDDPTNESGTYADAPSCRRRTQPRFSVPLPVAMPHEHPERLLEPPRTLLPECLPERPLERPRTRPPEPALERLPEPPRTRPFERAPERPIVPLEPGRRIPGSRYRIVRRLGEGAMGVVYEAEHIDMERRVAVKILRAEIGHHPEIVRAFRDEARAASRIQSDFIVQLHDFAELPDKRLMIAMELLTGRPLGQELSRPLELSRAVGILRQVCQGLAAAHAAGVVHRDIKPDNIFLTTRDGRTDAVKLVDFGIAAIHDGTNSPAIWGGTPNYLAPEVAISGSMAPSVDVYAFGCMAFQLLTGEVPFPSESIDAVLRAHRELPPPLPSAHRPEVPAALDAVVLGCLAKDPAERFASMTEVEAALCEAQLACGLRTAWDDLPVPTVEPERRDRLLALLPDVPVPARPRSSAGALAVLSVLLLLGTTMAVLSSTDPDATEGLAPSTPNERAARHIEAPLVLSSSERPVLAPTIDHTARARDRAGERQPRTAAVAQTPADSDRANGLAREGQLAFGTGELERAQRLFERALEHDRHNPRALAGLRDVAYERSAYDQAAALGERLVRVRPRNARAHLRLGDAYFKTQRLRDALEQYERAKELGERHASSRIRKVRSKLDAR